MSKMKMIKELEFQIVRRLPYRLNIFYFWLRDCLIKDLTTSWRSWQINEIGLYDTLWECRDRFREIGGHEDMMIFIEEGTGIKE